MKGTIITKENLNKSKKLDLSKYNLDNMDNIYNFINYIINVEKKSVGFFKNATICGLVNSIKDKEIIFQNLLNNKIERVIFNKNFAQGLVVIVKDDNESVVIEMSKIAEAFLSTTLNDEILKNEKGKVKSYEEMIFMITSTYKFGDGIMISSSNFEKSYFGIYVGSLNNDESFLILVFYPFISPIIIDKLGLKKTKMSTILPSNNHYQEIIKSLNLQNEKILLEKFDSLLEIFSVAESRKNALDKLEQDFYGSNLKMHNLNYDEMRKNLLFLDSVEDYISNIKNFKANI